MKIESSIQSVTMTDRETDIVTPDGAKNKCAIFFFCYLLEKTLSFKESFL